MNDERWEELKKNLKKKFSVSEEKTEDLMMDTGEGTVKHGEQNVIVVTTPAGKIKLVREIRPLVLEKKLHYTHQQGKSASFEYKFSETEKTHKLRFFKWNENEYDWQELRAEDLGGMMQ